MVSFRNLLLCLFLLNLPEINSYRILVIIPFNPRSHTNMLESVAKALATRGHQVDVISHYELKNPPKNYTTIINLDGTMPNFLSTWTMEMVDVFNSRALVSIASNDFGNDYCQLMSLKEMQKFIKNPPKYDLVVTEALAATCYIGFGHILKVPVVAVTALIQFFWFEEIMGNPMSPAFAVQMDTTSGRISTYWDRVKNTFWAHYNNYRFYKYTEKNQTETMRKYLSPNIPSIREIEKNVALVLVNTYQSMYGVKPNTPSFVQIAGIQIEQSESKMTPELQIWMDESTHGVIFLSLGSIIILEDSPEEVLLGMYASFAKIAPIRFLIKTANKEKLPPGLPSNVLTMSWIPQIAVLRHKNTRLFMTHGGINSLHEALYYAVPMIGFPLFADQMLNIKLLAAKNVVYEMEYPNGITKESLDTALNIVLNDPKYREAAKRESRLFKDRPMSATDTAIFWIEYVIRNGGNSLKSPAKDLVLWKVELLDVYGFFLLCFLLTIYVAFKILRLFICKFLISNSRRHRKKD